MSTECTRIPVVPELARSLPFGVTRADLRRWLDATDHLFDDSTAVLVASDAEGNTIAPLREIGVEIYRVGGPDGVETVHPADVDDEDDPLPVAIVLWP